MFCCAIGLNGANLATFLDVVSLPRLSYCAARSRWPRIDRLVFLRGRSGLARSLLDRRGRLDRNVAQ
jgi:hypothetical protein